MLRWGSRLRFIPPIRPIRPQPFVLPSRSLPQTRAYRIGGPQPQYKRFGRATNIFQRWAARPTFYREVGLVSVGAGGVYVYNLEEVPVSGRRRFNIISPDVESYIAKSSMEQIQQEYRGRFLPPYDPRVEQVKKVLERLIPFAEQAGLKDVDWEVHVIDSPEQNAFVIPGGKVFVFTGILPLCKNEDGIAAVLGHEVAHVVAHHTAERMSQAPLVLLGIIALWCFDVSFYSSKILLDIFLSYPGSRKQEAEADYIGLMMMSQGCYRPEAAMEFWHRMESTGQTSPPQVLSTHPSNHNREEKIREWLPKAREKADQSDCAATMSYADQFSAAFGHPRSAW
ncbi:peptidase family M48-domain-containing protein [Lophiotrema nucula]|uniref:Peptidase family M48-domain-containing protein n=1 Tax=Lophiotrema nucula TaxID=690887 RepID=A0A6A5YI36_9PLEO|nr:peptidase family M48-domain-containing protein [Lophiotrema nucula]